MPNHCLNTLTISGITPDQWTQLAATFNGTDEKQGSFLRTFCPEPDWVNIPNEMGEFPVLDQETGSCHWSDGKSDNRWYQWRIKHWGTKWDVYECDEELINQTPCAEIVVSYSTAWSPVNEHFLETASNVFPEALFVNRYEEEGEDYCGVTVAKAGKALDFTESLSAIRDAFVRKLNPDLPDDADTYEVYEEQELWEEFSECIGYCLCRIASDLTQQLNESLVSLQ